MREFHHSSNPGFDCAERVLLLPFGRESYLPAIVGRYGGKRVPLDATTDRIAYQLTGAPRPTTLVYTGMGSPAAANGLEMIAANGGRRVVLFGACGGVMPEIGVGDLIVAERAYPGEGTSRYYRLPDAAGSTGSEEGQVATETAGSGRSSFAGSAGSENPTAPIEDLGAACAAELTERLWTTASKPASSGAPAATGAVHRGAVYTTDAGYRQGPDIYDGTYDAAAGGRILGVENECSAAATVAAALGLELGALFFVTDNVTLPDAGDRAYRGLDDPRVRAGFETGLAAAVEALSRAWCDDPATGL